MIIERLIEFSHRFKYIPPTLSDLQLSDVRQKCLITGDEGPTLLVHPTFKKDGSWGLTCKGAIGGKLSSVNFGAGEYYGVDQGDVAPFGAEAALRLALAQAKLFEAGSRSRILLDDVTIAFWTRRGIAEIDDNLLWTWLGCGKQDCGKPARAEFFKQLNSDPQRVFPLHNNELACLLVTRKRQGRQVVLAFAELTISELLSRIKAWGGARKCLFDIQSLIAFVDGLDAPEMEFAVNALDHSRVDNGYLLGRRLAVIAKAADLLGLNTCVHRLVARRVQDSDIVMANSEFARNTGRLKRNNRFSAVGSALLRYAPATVPSELSTPFQSALHSGFDSQLKYLGQLKISKPHVTDNGIWVRSDGERLVANALLAMSIEWFYERPLKVPCDKASYRQPDFTLADGSLVEYLGAAHNKEDADACEARLELLRSTGRRVFVVDDRNRKPRTAREIFWTIEEMFKRLTVAVLKQHCVN